MLRWSGGLSLFSAAMTCCTYTCLLQPITGLRCDASYDVIPAAQVNLDQQRPTGAAALDLTVWVCYHITFPRGTFIYYMLGQFLWSCIRLYNWNSVYNYHISDLLDLRMSRSPTLAHCLNGLLYLNVTWTSLQTCVLCFHCMYLFLLTLFLLRSPFCDEIVGCRGDQLRLAVRVRVFTYPESACAVWIMFACKYRSVLWHLLFHLSNYLLGLSYNLCTHSLYPVFFLNIYLNIYF